MDRLEREEDERMKHFAVYYNWGDVGRTVRYTKRGDIHRILVRGYDYTIMGILLALEGDGRLMKRDEVTE